LNFLEVITENNYDFVEVFDGNSIRSKSIGKFSGSNQPATLISSSNSLTVNFKTDGSNVQKGFSAKYGIKKIFNEFNKIFLLIISSSKLW
jgi:hypothetical protein